MTTQTNEAGMKRAGRKVYGATALIALAVLFIGVTILITFVLRGARIDLTESKLYSIAPGTQRIVSSLAEPINLYFFFSQEASSQSPPLRAYAQRVRELLEEMEQRSKGSCGCRSSIRSRFRKTRTALRGSDSQPRRSARAVNRSTSGWPARTRRTAAKSFSSSSRTRKNFSSTTLRASSIG
jgi:ABC-type uncharacterized transport system